MINFFNSRFQFLNIPNFFHILMDPESYKIKAFNELGETDEIKSEKLREFRSWILNHQFLKNSRQGK